MGAHTRSMSSWYMGQSSSSQPQPQPPPPFSATGVGDAQRALSSSSNSGAGDASFDTNMVIILAALLFALLFAIGLNSLARLLIRCARGGASGAEAAAAASSSGIKKRALRSLPIEVYGACASGSASGAPAPADDHVCAICLGEFQDGEKVRVLPRCGHEFHVRCVDAWLASHDSCPTCRDSVLGGAADAPKRGLRPGSASAADGAAVTVVIA